MTFPFWLILWIRFYIFINKTMSFTVFFIILHLYFNIIVYEHMEQMNMPHPLIYTPKSHTHILYPIAHPKYHTPYITPLYHTHISYLLYHYPYYIHPKSHTQITTPISHPFLVYLNTSNIMKCDRNNEVW